MVGLIVYYFKVLCCHSSDKHTSHIHIHIYKYVFPWFSKPYFSVSAILFLCKILPSLHRVAFRPVRYYTKGDLWQLTFATVSLHVPAGYFNYVLNHTREKELIKPVDTKPGQRLGGPSVQSSSASTRWADTQPPPPPQHLPPLFTPTLLTSIRSKGVRGGGWEGGVRQRPEQVKEATIPLSTTYVYGIGETGQIVGQFFYMWRNFMVVPWCIHK